MTQTAETVEPAAAAASPGSTASPAADDTRTSSAQGQPADAPAADAAAASTDANTDADADELLLSDDEFEKLESDPAALRKTLQTAFTQKTQKLGPARQLLNALAKDPDSVIRAMAKARGLNVSDNSPASKVDTAADEIHTQFEVALGPEVAKVLMPAIDKMVEKHLTPLRKAHEESMTKAAIEHAKVIEANFTKQRPDWKQHEAKMMDLAQRVAPGKLEPLEYLDLLYVAATKGVAVSKSAEALVDRINGSARAAAESKVSSAGVATTNVAKPSPKRPSIREAAEAAMRGERIA
jgi:hypothetical protein